MKYFHKFFVDDSRFPDDWRYLAVLGGAFGKIVVERSSTSDLIMSWDVLKMEPYPHGYT